MTESKRFIKKINKQFKEFETTMEELHLLRNVADDLRSFRKMIKPKRYD